MLHQMMRVRWTAWKALPAAERSEIAREAAAVLAGMEKNPSGQSAAFFSLLGHKGDLMLVHFRRSFDELNQVERQLAQPRLADFWEPTTSYLSVVELGLYESTVKIYSALAERGIGPHPGVEAEKSRRRWPASARPCIRACFRTCRPRTICAFIRWIASAASRRTGIRLPMAERSARCTSTA